MKAICTSLLLVISLISFGQKKKMSMEDKKKYYHEKMEEFKKNPSALCPWLQMVLEPRGRISRV